VFARSGFRPSRIVAGLLALSWLGLACAQQPFTAGTEIVVEVDVLRVRAGPGLSNQVVGRQERGARGVVADASPHWADGFWWWDIAYADGVRGWSADGDATSTYLAPMVPGERRTAGPTPERPQGPLDAVTHFVEIDSRGVLSRDGPIRHALTAVGDGEFQTPAFTCGRNSCIMAIAIESEYRWAQAQDRVTVVDHLGVGDGSGGVRLMVFDDTGSTPYRAAVILHHEAGELVYVRFARSTTGRPDASLFIIHDAGTEASRVRSVVDSVADRLDEDTFDGLRRLSEPVIGTLAERSGGPGPATEAASQPVPSVASRSSLTIVVIPSIMSALSLARAELVVVIEGPERHQRIIPDVAPAFPVTVVFDDIPAGTYSVSAQHGASRLRREIAVQGQTLQVDFVMP
jgi:hypothetical protein